MTPDDLLDEYLFATAAGPFTAADALSGKRARDLLRIVVGLPGVRGAIERAMADRP